jgi:hypothetical protein
MIINTETRFVKLLGLWEKPGMEGLAVLDAALDICFCIRSDEWAMSVQ